jgi:carboxylesterase type B
MTDVCSLYLNVWVPPSVHFKQTLPVKIFYYGGSFTSGSNSQPLYNGCNLATDAIVVTVNYRLGSLGWLSLKSAGITGNMGLEDSILGAQWVQENIAAFGGDPVRTLMFTSRLMRDMRCKLISPIETSPCLWRVSGGWNRLGHVHVA